VDKNYFAKGALHNIVERSNPVYVRGIIIGLVSAWRDQGASFGRAMDKLSSLLPESYSLECIPEMWQEDLLRAEQGRWVLDVGFVGCLPEDRERFHTKANALDYVRQVYDDLDYRGMITDLRCSGRWDHPTKTLYAELFVG